jgi:hypothetical protein
MSTSPPRRIVGEWLEKDGQVVANQECRIIQHLIADHFVRAGSREGGWTALFRDPTDGSLWELTYPHSERHGGGPPTLTQLTDQEARELYGHLPP